jgi:hypothetical protein
VQAKNSLMVRLWDDVAQYPLRESISSFLSSNNKTDHHDIAEILLKVALSTL